MRQLLALPLLAAFLGLVMAVVAFAAPFGNTGVDGTLGAGLAVLGALATTLLIAVLMTRRAGRRWAVILHGFGLLAALLTAVAALFLMQTALTVLMAVAFVTLLIAGVMPRRRIPA